MSWWVWVLVVLAAAAVAYLLFALVLSLLLWRTLPRKPAPPSPTLHEIHAADMDHWDQRFYAALADALPDGTCNCNPYPFSCPIHQSAPEHCRDLRGIRRHIRNNQRMRKTA